MHKTISCTWPWTKYRTPELIVTDALMLGADDICIRATDGNAMYGVGLVTKAQWRGKCYYDLEKAAKAAGLTTSIWCAMRLVDWAGEAAIIHKAAAYYNPPVVNFDAEGMAKANIGNLGPFLRALGRVGDKVVALQSYRMAHLHAELAWAKWYGYKDQATGRYVIDAMAHQLYPIGTRGLKYWIEDWKRAIASHEAQAVAVGRPGMPWYPTVPCFIGGTYEGQSTPWVPSGEELLGAIEWLRTELGERLKGINFWALDTDLVKMPELMKAVAGWQPVTVTPPVAPPDMTVDERLDNHERRIIALEGNQQVTVGA